MILSILRARKDSYVSISGTVFGGKVKTLVEYLSGDHDLGTHRSDATLVRTHIVLVCLPPHRQHTFRGKKMNSVIKVVYAHEPWADSNR
jgi:hypothetical protein